MLTWASTLRPAEGDKYGILASLSTLTLAYSRVRKKLNNHSKEHTQRRGIHDIIDSASSAKLDRHCDFKYILSPQAIRIYLLQPWH